MRKCCLIHLKKSSTCQRLLYNAAIVSAGKVVLFVRKINCFNIAQAFAPRHLRKGHCAKLFSARQATYTGVAAVVLDDALETRPGNEIHDLSGYSG